MSRTVFSDTTILVITLLLTISVIAPATVGTTAAEPQSDYSTQSSASCTGEIDGVPSSWNQTYGGEDIDSTRALTQTDNQILIAGSTKSYNAEPDLRQDQEYDGWIVSLHENGTERWNESYGNDSGHLGYGITNATSNGSLLVGIAKESDGHSDGWAVRVASNGSVIWDQELGQSGTNERFNDAAARPEGGFYAVGTNENSRNDDAAWLVTLNASGEVINERVYPEGNKAGISFTDIYSTTTGYLIAGQKGSQVWLMQLDENGTEVWNHTYVDTKKKSVNDLVVNNGQITVVGRSDAHNNDGSWLASLNSNGVLRWERTYGGSVDKFESLVAVDQTGYLIAGSTWTCSQESATGDYSLTKIRPNTSLKWTSQYGGLEADQAYETISPRTGQLWLVGITRSYGANGWVVNVPIEPTLPSIQETDRPPQDPDLDGLFEDVNGDGQLNITDVLTYYNNRNKDIIRNNENYFDFDGDGATGTMFDALELYNEIS